MEYIYVQNDDGTPLMPTTRMRHIRTLLNKGRARIISHTPLVIRLRYHSEGITQPLYGGTDPGRTNVGEAVLTGQGRVTIRTKLETRNKEIPKLMKERAAHRSASRRGERQVRKRRAEKCGTTTEFPEGRMLPGYDEPLMLKDIINTESRFNNRKRPDGWLTPTARQLAETHLAAVRKIRALLPVSDWTLEMNKFAFMRMDDGSVYGSDFQNGRMKTYKSVNDYVYARQGGRCYLCGAPIEEYHHIMPQHERGSDTPEDKVGLCRCCHQKVHTGRASIDIKGFRKKYDALSVLNQAIPYIKAGLVEMFGKEHVHETTGWRTKQRREDSHLDKDHDIDAVCIAAAGMPEEKIITDDMPECLTILQFRRHDRALVNNQRERTYKLHGETAAENRRPRFEQPKKTPALSDWYALRCRQAGKKQAQKER